MTNKPMLSVEREHRLKIHRKPFLDLESGAKTCEIRDCSDRDFQVGDSVLLVLVDETGNPAANELRRKITHIQTGYGLPDDLCVLSYEPAAQHQGEPVAWRGLNAGGEVVTEWMDGQPPERMTDLCGNAASFDKIERAYAEQPAPVAVVMPELESAFEAWWESDGQYCRAGGGSYEKTFAYRGYEAALAEVARLNGVKP